ncbi:hypothetical protein J2S21_000441 [Peribacillus cavernae]|nr:hypothetical protein [Peribacillus cavernae]
MNNVLNPLNLNRVVPTEGSGRLNHNIVHLTPLSLYPEAGFLL